MARRPQPPAKEGLVPDASPAEAEAAIRPALETGLRLQREGRLEEAAQLYRKILQRFPKHPNALHLLGVIAHQRGDHGGAIELMLKAIAVRDTNQVFHGNLGEAYRALGRLDEAIAACRRALDLYPVYPQALNTMGAALSGRGEFGEAEAALKRAIDFKPNFAEAHANLGNVYRVQGKMAAAADSYTRALAGLPNNVALLNNLANVLAAIGKPGEAAARYQEAVRVEPELAETHVNLANLLKNEGRLEEALASYRQALAVRPDDPRALVGEARVLELEGHFDEALARLEPLIEAGLEDVNLAAAFASLAEWGGRQTDAAALLERLLQRSDLDDEARALLLFKLGRVRDQSGAYDAAFACFREAHSLTPQTFDVDEHATFVTDLIESFTREASAALPRASNRSDLPVFIVGMPRSGTSLVEQILASHPQAFGAGELPDIGRMAAAVHVDLGVEPAYPRCLASLTQEWLDAAAERYLLRLEELAAGTRRVTDKMPDNFLYLGLVARLFPKARVIHCRRDPLDTCLSCYCHNFAGDYPFTERLETLAAYYLAYRRLMRHWKEVLDIPLMEVRYERLVERQEEVSREIVAFLGLDWDDRCLRFHESPRAMRISNRGQVRRPIYRSSVGRWRHYEHHLGPLIEALGEEGHEADPAGT